MAADLIAPVLPVSLAAHHHPASLGFHQIICQIDQMIGAAQITRSAVSQHAKLTEIQSVFRYQNLYLDRYNYFHRNILLFSSVENTVV